MITLNYEELNVATHIVRGTPREYDKTGVTETINSDAQPVDIIYLRSGPSSASEVVKEILPGQLVTMLREWASGNGDWAYVKHSSGTKGYILTRHLQIASAFVSNILPKAIVDLQPMTELARALVPEKSWMEQVEQAPYYHTENGEYWFSVTLPYTCIEDGSLGSLSAEAKQAAISSMYEYFDINPSSIVPTQQGFYNGLQSAYVKDYFLGTRPGSELMMLVTIPAIYVKYLQENTNSTEVGEIDEDYCISIQANTLKDLDRSQSEIVKCLVRQYQLYLDSNIKVSNFNFENEIFKQTEGISQIKFLLKQNSIKLDATENQTSKPDTCLAAPSYKKIQICFDEEYMLKAVYYYNGKGEKKLLSSGLSVVKNSFPFNEKRFGYLFLNQKVICSLPELTLKTFLKEYIIDPIPECTIDESPDKAKTPSPYAQKELGTYVNTALFLTSMAKEFGNIYDLNRAGAGNIGYNCYSSNKAVEAFKLKALDYRDSQFMFSGDMMAFFQWVCNLKFSDMEEAVEKAGNGTGDWGWEWLLGDSEAWDIVFSIRFSEIRIPTFSFIDALYSISLEAFEAAVDALIKKIIEFFLTIKCELLLAGVAAAGAIGAGAGIAAYYASQGKSNKLGESTSALPSPAELSIRDYGGENCNSILQDSIGVSSDEYDKYLLEIFQRCGVYLSGEQESLPKAYLDAISLVTSPVELLSLLSGSASNSLINFILKYTQKEFPIIYQSKNTSSKISGLFVCLGENTTQEVVAEVEQKIQDKVNDLEFCEDLSESLKGIMKEKCPNPEVYESVYEKEFGSKIETYQKIISLLGDECNNVKINLFNNPETGEKGILNVLNGKMKGQDKMVDNVGESILGSTKITAIGEAAIPLQSYEDLSNILSPKKLVFVSGQGTSKSGQQTGTTYQFYGSDGVLTFGESPVFKLQNDGTNYIQDTVPSENGTGKIYTFSYPISSVIQSVLQKNANYSFAENYLNLSTNQMIFYSLIDDYVTKNSKDKMGNLTSSPYPYGVTNSLLSDPAQDEFFSMIFKTMIEKCAIRVGAAWEGDQDTEDTILEYSKALSQNADNIINYDQAKKNLKSYFDAADNDDPTDDMTISPKQFGMMNSAMYCYVRLHIMEYLTIALPFYNIFDFSNSSDAEEPYELYPDIIKNLIRDRIIEDMKTRLSQSLYDSYLSFMNKTYDFVKKKNAFQTKEYTGVFRSLDYYIESNYKDVYNRFNDALDQVPENYKKPKYNLEEGLFIYSKTESLPVHDYSGTYKLFVGGPTPSILGSKSCVKDVSGKAYSLFSNTKYNKFKNGMFFIQNYFYVENTDNLPNEFDYFNDREYHLTGILNLQHLKDINDYIAFPNYSLKDLFKTVKIGSRLCYGIAHNDKDNDTNKMLDLKDFSKKVFLNYQAKYYDGAGGNNGNLSNSEYESSKIVLPLQKSVVCVDGDNMNFVRKGIGGTGAGVNLIWVAELNQYLQPNDPYFGGDGYETDWIDMEAGESFISYDDETEQKFEYAYRGDSSNYSLVIPIFSVESEVNMDQSWESFYSFPPNLIQSGQLNLITNFQNLNNDLINSKEYKALIKNCFSPQNMVHFSGLSGLRITGVLDKVNFDQTKNLFATNIKNIVNAKKVT